MSAKKQAELAAANVIYRATARYLAPSQSFQFLLAAVLLGLSWTTCCMEAPQDSKAAGRNETPNTSSAQSPSKEAQQAAWNKILPLISKRLGYVEPREVEKTFGIKLVDGSTEIIKQTVAMHDYLAKSGSTLPLHASLLIFKDIKNTKQKPWSSFEVFFRDRSTPEGLSKPCLPAKQILQDLRQQGWQAEGRDMPDSGRRSGITDLYAINTTNDYIVHIGTDPSLCLDSVSVYDKAKQ